MSENLTKRIAKKAAAGKQVVRQPAGASPTLSGFVEALRGESARALPEHLSADRMARIALTELRRVPHLPGAPRSRSAVR